MKHKQLDNFIGEIKSIKMTELEKNTIRKQLVSFTVGYRSTASPYQNMMSMAKRGFTLAFVIIFSIISFSNAASKNSLPGDMFYPVKIVHEEIALATTFGTSKKINYEIRRTEKRIQEAAQLVQNKELDTPDQQRDIVENIKEQTNKVKEHIENVKEKNPEAALILNAELKSTVETSQEALRKVGLLVNNTPEQFTESDDNLLLNKEIPLIDEEVSAIDPSDTVQGEGNPPLLQPFSENAEPENVQPSFVDSLLENLEEEVQDIEALGENIEEEILEQTSSKNEENGDESKDTIENELGQSDDQPENKNTDSEEPLDIESISNEIQLLNTIVEVEKSIKSFKESEEMHLHSITPAEGKEVVFDELELRKEADEFIANKQYKQALEKFQEILEHFKNDETEKEQKNLDIDSLPSEETTTDLDIIELENLPITTSPLIENSLQ